MNSLNASLVICRLKRTLAYRSDKAMNIHRPHWIRHPVEVLETSKWNGRFIIRIPSPPGNVSVMGSLLVQGQTQYLETTYVKILL